MRSKYSIKGFLSYYRPYKRLLFADLFCSFIVAVIALLLPICVRYITVEILERGMHNAARSILETGLVMLLLVIIQTLCTLFYDYRGHDMGAKIERDMRKELFAHCQTLPISFFDSMQTGKIMSRLTNDLLNLAELYHHGPENLVIYGLEFLGSLILLFVINIRLALVVFAFLPVMISYSIVCNRKLKKAYEASYECISEINAQTEDSISGIRVVKSFARESLEQKKFAAKNQLFYKSRSDIYKNEAFHFTVMESFFTPLISIAVIVFGAIWITGEKMVVGDLLVFILYIAYLTAPIPKLAFMVQQYQEGLAAYRRFSEIMDMRAEMTDEDLATELPKVKGKVVFKDVAFKYHEDHEYVLRGINLTVLPGQTVAIVGRSGVGKTTLCSLLPRFYDPTQGKIYIDGFDIHRATLESLRAQIGIVMQDNFLFSGTVIENIRYGKLNASMDEVIEAAKRAGAHAFIQSLPDGYNTDIGQRGVKLSGGQKQRLSIARVLLKDPPILIFDEATSSLDYESEKIVLETLRILSSNRTTFVIAHRLSAIRHADQIFVLTNEGITEQGTHEELLAQNGTYADIYYANQ